MILKYDKINKTKTFETEGDIKWFLGLYKSDIIHKPVNEETYIQMCLDYDIKMQWDDGTEMTPEEWVKCSMILYENFE